MPVRRDGAGEVSVARDEWEALNARLKEAEAKLASLQSGAHSAAPPQGDEFLATLAHELRNPLTAIRSAVDIMRLIGHKDAALDRARGLISRQVDRMSVLVDDLVVRLPFPHAETAPARSGLVGSRSRDLSRRIVVIDDNEDAAESLAMLLRLKGHDVETAYDGGTGVEAALKSDPDCVLVDIGLPGMDGYEVARRLRSHDRDRRMLLIAVTGYSQAQDRSRSHEAGFDHHLVKPVTQSVLEDLLRER